MTVFKRALLEGISFILIAVLFSFIISSIWNFGIAKDFNLPELSRLSTLGIGILLALSKSKFQYEYDPEYCFVSFFVEFTYKFIILFIPTLFLSIIILVYKTFPNLI